MERSEERRLKRGPGAISVGRRVRSAKTCRARHALPTVLGRWRDEDRDGSMLLMAFCCVRVAGQQVGGGGAASRRGRTPKPTTGRISADTRGAPDVDPTLLFSPLSLKLSTVISQPSWSLPFSAWEMSCGMRTSQLRDRELDSMLDSGSCRRNDQLGRSASASRGKSGTRQTKADGVAVKS